MLVLHEEIELKVRQIGQEDDAAKIAQAAIEILRAREGKAISLQQLGLEIVQRERIAIRQSLGTKPLGMFLREQFPDQIRFLGESKDKEVVLDTPSQASLTKPRFDSAVFTAFSQELPVEQRRWLKPERPFRFKNTDGDPPEPSWIEVPRDIIPGSIIPRPERTKLVEAAIVGWCEINNLDPQNFLSVSTRKPETSSISRGTMALKAMVDAIPASERHQYSLPIDLISRLLDL